MVKDYLNGQMAENMRDNGLMENSMDLEHILTPKELKEKAYGKKVNVLDGIVE